MSNFEELHFEELSSESIQKINQFRNAKQLATARNKKIWEQATTASLGKYFGVAVPKDTKDMTAAKFKASVLSSLDGKNLQIGNKYEVDVIAHPDNKEGGIAVRVSLKVQATDPANEPTTEPANDEPSPDELAKAQAIIEKSKGTKKE